MINVQGQAPLRRIVIIGGGVSGLSAAWLLNEQAQASGASVQITVLEAATRFGGKVRTETVDGYGDKPFIIEAGPDSFLTQSHGRLNLPASWVLNATSLGQTIKSATFLCSAKGAQ